MDCASEARIRRPVAAAGTSASLIRSARECGVPVLVEGPMGAIAVTLASAGRCVGQAPLGTSLTHEQFAQLVPVGRDPIASLASV